MVRQLIVACLVYAALVLQPSVADDFGSFGIRPWLPGIALVACVWVLEGPASLVWAMVLGLGVDGQAVDYLGIHSILATLIACTLTSIQGDLKNREIDSVNLPSFVTNVVSVFTATWIWRTAASLIHAHLDRHSVAIREIAWSSFSVAISTAALVAVGLIGVRLASNPFRRRDACSVELDNQWTMLTQK